MPGTVDDFIQRFGNSETMDDREAAHIMDRFSSSHPDDKDFDVHSLSSGTTEYLGKLPPQQFQEAAQSVYASAPPSQQQGLAASLLRALQGRGINTGFLGSLLGQPSVPQQLSPNQYAQLADYARQQHPEAMQEVVRDQPWFVKALGHPVMMGSLAMVASKMLHNRLQSDQSRQNPENPGGFRRIF